MTASIISERPVAGPAFGRFAGPGALVRKDATEWLRGRRAWVVAVLTTLFMVLTAANSWIIDRIREADPNYVPGDHAPTSLAPLDNIGAAMGSQIFVLAAIFAVASLIVVERQTGTLAWVVSKPVSRSSVFLAKFLSAAAMMTVSAVLIPASITVLAVTALYGAPDLATISMVVAGAAALVVFFTALGLAAGAVLPGQPAVAATGFIAFGVVPLVLGALPLPIGEFLPTSILAWAFGAASGQPVGWHTPIATAAWIAATVSFGAWQLRRLEL